MGERGGIFLFFISLYKIIKYLENLFLYSNVFKELDNFSIYNFVKFKSTFETYSAIELE